MNPARAALVTTGASLHVLLDLCVLSLGAQSLGRQSESAPEPLTRALVSQRQSVRTHGEARMPQAAGEASWALAADWKPVRKGMSGQDIVERSFLLLVL